MRRMRCKPYRAETAVERQRVRRIQLQQQSPLRQSLRHTSSGEGEPARRAGAVRDTGAPRSHHCRSGRGIEVGRQAGEEVLSGGGLGLLMKILNSADASVLKGDVTLMTYRKGQKCVVAIMISSYLILL